MPDSSDDERDSRTAALGGSRSRSDSSASTSRGRAKNSVGRKKDKLKNDLQDLIPRGAAFTTTPLVVDQDDATSSSGSGSSGSEKDGAGSNNTTKSTTQNKGPAINWNQASRSAIRTTLGKRKAPPAFAPAQEKSAFDAVNDKYFRSRSASISDDESQGSDAAKVPNGREEDGQSTSYYVDDSEGSESGEISEGGDSMMLNLGQEDGAIHDNDDSRDASFFFDTTPAQIPTETQVDDKSEALSNGTTAQTRIDGVTISKEPIPLRSKAAALAELASRYETAPATLADLKHRDLQIQIRYFFANRRNDEVDLSLPISCTECLQNGHLALVCPSKECQHCGAWDQHEDRLCPAVRRCQKCREVGHDAQDCHSPLKSSAAETPCEFCGADTHLEFDCDKLWKFPHLQAFEAPIKVSISCSYCTNKNHLLGDCPLKKVPTTSSTFSLKAYTPSSITNLNSLLGPRKADQQKGMRGRGLPPSPQDDDNMLALHNPPVQRPPGGRGKIQIKGLASNRNLGGGPPPLPREPPPSGPPPFRPRDYRDRDQGYRYRERSRSPRLPSKPPGNFSQGSRKPPPPRGGRNGGGGRGRGRGRDQYRPGRP